MKHDTLDHRFLWESLQEAGGLLESARSGLGPAMSAFALLRCVRLALDVDKKMHGTFESAAADLEADLDRFVHTHSNYAQDEADLKSLFRELEKIDRRFRDVDSNSGSDESEVTALLKRALFAVEDIFRNVRSEYCKVRPWRYKLAFYKKFLVLLAAISLIWLAARTSLFMWAELSSKGIQVTYYKGENFEKRICRWAERAVFKDYGRNSPAFLVPKNHFSARWEGVLAVPVDAEYSFFSQSNDGLRMYIDGKPVIDNWRNQDWDTSGSRGQMRLTAGKHGIVVEHYDSRGEAALRVRWQGGPVPPDTVISVPYLRKKR